LSVARDILAGPDGASLIAHHNLSSAAARSPGYHTGRNFILIEKAPTWPPRSRLPGSDLLVIEYLDARGSDGSARKYRVMMIDRQIYPMHLAILTKWKCIISPPTWPTSRTIGPRISVSQPICPAVLATRRWPRSPNP